MKDAKRLTVRKSRLEGLVEVGGAKNSALRLLAATILTKGMVKLTRFPAGLLDAQIHLDMLRALGKKYNVIDNETVAISEDQSLQSALIWPGRSIRNTLLILGCLVARLGEGRVPLPGGCKLGERKYDLHVMLLERLGARVWEEEGFLCAAAEKGLLGSDIHLPMRSTGATENAILCASLAKGVTRIWGPHIRPEILDLIEMLKSMGASIKVFGQEHIEVIGCEELSGVDHEVIPDNMEAITWLIAASITAGDVEINRFPSEDLEVVLSHLKAAGAAFFVGDNSVIVRGSRCYPLEVSTGPHPGINSDVQPILAAWAAKSIGESRIIDLRFPGRYGYADEMAKMGLQHTVVGDVLHLNGSGGNLTAASVRALDLRAGAALALCGLIADGETVISDAWQIQRGYQEFDAKLRGLGAYAVYE